MMLQYLGWFIISNNKISRNKNNFSMRYFLCFSFYFSIVENLITNREENLFFFKFILFNSEKFYGFSDAADN